ncbi:CD3E protein, partial [Erithacus rubecula]|nr:CD3E protein [Erithacus rubecula]
LPLVSFLMGAPSQGEFLVEISGTTVTITCPFEDEDIRWELSGRTEDTKERKLVIKDHDSTPANLSCSLGTQRRQLYLNARVCANCEELDALTVAGIITADLLITLGVLILVYYCSRGSRARASAAGERRPRACGAQVRIPGLSSLLFPQPIRKGQREVYAGLEPRGF